MSSTKDDKTITWLHVLLTFLIAFALPVFLIYLAAEAVDSGYFGGRPGYVEGEGILVWMVERLHIVIIAAFFGFFIFLSVLVMKIHQLYRRRKYFF